MSHSRNWHTDNPHLDLGPTEIDRRVQGHAGPPVHCCERTHVIADEMIRVPDAILARVQARFPHLEGDGPHYLCSGCSSRIVREGLVEEREFYVHPPLPDSAH